MTANHTIDHAVDTPEIRTSGDGSFDSPVIKLQSPPKSEDPFKSSSEVKRVSIGKTIVERPTVDRADSSTTVQDFASAHSAEEKVLDNEDEKEKIAPSTPPMVDATEENSSSPTGVTVPGGFD